MNGEVKLECARRFSELLVEKLGGRVYRVVLFGSVAKGEACEHSDIDILVVVDRVDEEVHKALADASFKIGVEKGEGVEYIVMEMEEYMAKKSDNPLLYEVERSGKPLHSNPTSRMRRAAKLTRLAQEYAGYARASLARLAYRDAIDLGHNAVELLVKALIIAEHDTLPRTHGGYIHRFGELYVLTGRADRELVRGLYRALELRNKARYDPDYTPTEDEARLMLNLYNELKNLADRVLKHGEDYTGDVESEPACGKR